MLSPTNDAPDPTEPNRDGGECDEPADAENPELSARLAALTPEQRKLLRRKLNQRRDRREGAADSGRDAGSSLDSDSVAIVGMGCRLPGADSPHAFWRLIRDAGEAVGPVPSGRWDQRRFFDPTGRSPGKMSVDAMAAVDGIDQFDPAFFGIAPREAAKMDPQQRLLLEVTWEAFENAGIPVDSLAGSDTGVFVGIGGNDYAKVPARYPDYFEQVDAYTGTGNALSIAAGRISYLLDFHGPAFAVDTACSSGLVAVHSAAVSLRRGECSAAVAGGVNLILTPETTIAFSKANMLSPDGRCRPFDAAANGYVRGEGCGVVLLKRLKDAIRDGDQMFGILRGSAVNQDGRTSGMTAPSGSAQQRVIAEARRVAGVTPDDLSYVEAHGTGTPLGDPIELMALAETLAGRSGQLPPVCVGSVKANVGHTETVAGVAGLLKVLLMFGVNEIPRQANFRELNPNARLPQDTLVVADQTRRWLSAANGRRVAGISSFGFGGTNAHVILEHPDAAGHVTQPPRPGASPLRVQTSTSTEADDAEACEQAAPDATGTEGLDPPRVLCLPLSARQPPALRELAGRMECQLGSADPGQAYDVCATAAIHRMALPRRAAVVASAPETLRERLNDLEQGRAHPDIVTGRVPGGARPRIAMLFTGQGCQYAGMGRLLAQSLPRFEESLHQAAAVLDPILPASLGRILDGGSAEFPLDHTAAAQPAIVAVECALADAFAEVGIRPQVVAGHSIGEISALYAAGGLEHEQALRIAAYRGAAMGELPSGGRMAALLTGVETARALIDEAGNGVAIAAMNGPQSTVVSGRAEAVDRVIGLAERGNIPTRPLAVSHAFHSALMEPAVEPFRRRLEAVCGEIRWGRDVTFISSMTGGIENGPIDADYWLEHLLRPVQFTDVIAGLEAQHINLAIETGPGTQLCSMVRRGRAATSTKEAVPPWAVLPALGKDGRDEHHWTTAVAGAWCVGAPVDWKRLFSRRPYRRSTLPNYPFQRQRYWYDPPASVGGGDLGPLIHPLLGSRQELATGGAVYNNVLRDNDPAYFRDHVVSGSVTVPAAAWIETLRAAASHELGSDHVEIQQFEIERPVFVAPGEPVTIQTVVGSSRGGSCRLQVSVRGGSGDQAWQRCVSGSARTLAEGDVPLAKLSPPNPRARRLETESLYRELAEAGLEYGELFRTLRDVRGEHGAASAELALAPSLQSDPADATFHPTLLDGALQLIAATTAADDQTAGRDTYLPVGIGRCRFVDGGRVSMAVTRRSTEASPGSRPTEITADLELFDEDHRWVASLEDVRLTRLTRESAGGESTDASRWLYRIEWEPIERGQLLSTTGERGGTVEGLPKRYFGNPWFGPPTRSVRLPDVDQGEADQDTDPASAGVADREHWVWAQPTAEGDDVDGGEPGGGVAAASESLLTTLQSALSESVTPVVSVLTRGAFEVPGDDAPVDPVASAVVGLARVAAVEHPQLQLRIIDADQWDAASLNAIEAWLDRGSGETEVAIRAQRWYAPRLRSAPGMLSRSGDAAELPVPNGGNYRVRLDGTNRIEGLWMERTSSPTPQAGEASVRVRAAGLNFSDVLKTIGLYPGIRDAVVPLGIEVCGEVISTGPDVDGLPEGTRVMGIVPYGFASEATTDASLLVPVPPSLADEEAAAIPIVFLTAHHALLRVGRLRGGERVLIHAGAGGVGLAAIKIAQSIDATIYTTAGQPAKRRLLADLGVDPENIFDSRDLRSIDRIRERTGGCGVDVVLNSLPGDWIDASLGLLAAHGRFLEIGKSDIYQDRPIGLAPFQDNLTFSAIDLDRLFRERPGESHELFLEVAERFREGIYAPLPLTQFRLDELPSALRFMAARRNIGKIVLSTPARSNVFDVPGTHLITGGSGAIARGVAEGLMARGARGIALVARSEPPEHLESLRRLAERCGTRLDYFQADCADLRSMGEVIDQLNQRGQPIVGVVHAAGLLDDQLVQNLSQDALAKVLRPKVAGAIVLDRVTAGQSLAYFAMLGSIASVFGSPGQGNYAAANGFLDGFAADRRRRGLPASTILWGPWGASSTAGGMAGDSRKQRNLAARGLRPLPFNTAIELLLDAATDGETRGGVIVDAAWSTMLSGTAADRLPSVFRSLDRGGQATDAAATSSRDHALLGELYSLDRQARADRLSEVFEAQLVRIMSLSGETIDPETPLGTLGLDSLMAIELKNTIETQLGVSLPISRFIGDPTLRDLTTAATDALESAQLADAEVAEPADER